MVEQMVTREALSEWHQIIAEIDAVRSDNVAQDEVYKLQAELQETHHRVKILQETVEHLSKQNDQLRLQAQLSHVSIIADGTPVDKADLLVADDEKQFLDNICLMLSSAPKYQLPAAKICHNLRLTNIQLWNAGLNGRSFKDFVLKHNKRLLWDDNVVHVRQTNCWRWHAKGSCTFGAKCKFSH